MSLPPANSDISIPVLREALQSVYSATFNAFPYMRSIMDQLVELVSTSTNSTLIGDISWASDSLKSDSEKLFKIQTHIQFLNAEETFTTKNEMIKVFKEFSSFVDLILLGDLVTTLKGVAGTLTNEEKKLYKIEGRTLEEIVQDVQKFGVALDLTGAPIKQIETNELDHEIPLSHEAIQQLKNDVETRSVLLSNAVTSLKNLAA
jgi:hypothetical protein